MALLIPQAIAISGAEACGSLRNSSTVSKFAFESASKSDPSRGQVLSHTFKTSDSSSCISRPISSCISRSTLKKSSPGDELRVFKTSNFSSCMSRFILRNSWPRGQECSVEGIRIQNHNDLAMSSSAMFKNVVSSGAGRAAVWEWRSRAASAPAPVCLFGGLFGGNRKVKDAVPPKQQEFKYHDVPLPFPASLLSNTFLSECSAEHRFSAPADRCLELPVVVKMLSIVKGFSF